MGTEIASASDREAILGRLAPSWQGQSQTTRELLQPMAARFMRGNVAASLPYVDERARKVHWISVGSSLLDIDEYADDLRCWVLPYFGTGDGISLVNAIDASGVLGPLLIRVSPAGYLRWTSSLEHFDRLLVTLGAMHNYVDSRPSATASLRPSLSALRLRFVAAIHAGDWERADSAIAQIDRWSLDKAERTVQMRVRLLEAQGRLADVVALAESHSLWALRNPRRIATAMLIAVYREEAEPLERDGKYSEALARFREVWLPRLETSLDVSPVDGDVAPLHAYAACVAGDAQKLSDLAQFLSPGLAAFLRAEVASLAPRIEAAVPSGGIKDDLNSASLERESVGRGFWRELHSSVVRSDVVSTRALLEQLAELGLISEIDFVAEGPDALIRLAMDPNIETEPAARLLFQEALSALIDATLDSHTFPNVACGQLYLALADCLSLLHSSSASEEHSNLLVGLLGAVLLIDATKADQCVQLIRNWWGQRRAVARLRWLLGALEEIAPLHAEPVRLQDLWLDGIAVAIRHSAVLTATEVKTWARVAGILEISRNVVDPQLARLAANSDQEAPTTDCLATAGLKKIAIISLRETAAREAAWELQQRTKATVLLVTSKVQDDMTQAAQSAELILFVWAACSHSVFRAFDRCREKLAYVQGTGASSIVIAAEAWVAERL